MMKCMEKKIRNWRIKFNKFNNGYVSGWLLYEGKTIPNWGCGMSFILDEYSVRYDYPGVVPAYIDDRLEALREHIYM